MWAASQIYTQERRYERELPPERHEGVHQKVRTKARISSSSSVRRGLNRVYSRDDAGPILFCFGTFLFGLVFLFSSLPGGILSVAGNLLICLCSRLLLCLRIPLFFSVVFHLIVILWWSEGGDCLVGHSKWPPSLAPLEKCSAASFCTLDGSSSVFAHPHSSPNFQPFVWPAHERVVHYKGTFAHGSCTLLYRTLRQCI